MKVRFTAGIPRIAYHECGQGSETLVVVPGWVSHLEFDWGTPETRLFHERLALRRRVIRYDKRGTGMSDRPDDPDTYALSTRVLDLERVVDETCDGPVLLFGWSEGGMIAMAYAAKHPERVSRLVLFGTFARILEAHGYPGSDPSSADALQLLIRQEWGSGSRILSTVFLPEADDDRLRWFTEWQRHTLTPEGAVRSRQANMDTDIRDVLPRITAPTLVLHRRNDGSPERSEYLVRHIPNAEFQSLEGDHHVPFLGDGLSVVDAINAFLDRPLLPSTNRPPACSLTAREIDVLRLIAEGLSNREIAARLCLSEKTVNRHLANLYAKIDVHSRGAAIAYAFHAGYVRA